MKKWWLTLTAALLVFIGWGAWYIYDSNRVVSIHAADQAVTKARSHYAIGKVEDVTSYYGSNAYQVIKALRNGRRVYVWVPESGEKAPMFMRTANQGISRSHALAIFSTMHFNVQRVVSVRLGAINATPVWQVTFVAPNHTYNYIALNFSNGREVQRILNI
ncbi:MAG: DUF5590 domain-containing protein [Sporolactobacillus sp.]